MLLQVLSLVMAYKKKLTDKKNVIYKWVPSLQILKQMALDLKLGDNQKMKNHQTCSWKKLEKCCWRNYY